MATTEAPLEKKYVKTKIANLNASLLLAEDATEREDEIVRHIKRVENDPVFQLDPEFPPGLEWFNSGPLSFQRELRGKIVVLDFFTYCCINCMHVLPDLSKLEEKYSDREGVVVIGVHSAKFGNEKISDNIRSAIMRYNISHPVVNDKDIVLWERLGVVCWPTLVIIGPNCQLLHYIIGEGHADDLMSFMDTAVQYYKGGGKLSRDPVGISLASESLRTSVLKFPGKVCTDVTGEQLYVSDSAHNQILVVNRKTGAVEYVYGSGEVGLRDGDGRGARFHSPQGLAWHSGVLYVADTENHVIRKINLRTHTVTMIVGTGCQGNDKEGGSQGTEQVISSPWDVVVGTAPGSDHPNLLYIAMAGTHQVWVHFLEDAKWLKGSEHSAGTTLRFSGSGEEANRNNSYPHKAAFAQPSGITLASDGNLYIADSESSSVRAVPVATGSAKAVVGGAVDPLDLFAFGDVDGKGREARLQHPLGVAWNEHDKLLYVADSYNHKIKVVNPVTKVCTTLAGTGDTGLTNGPFEHAHFSEPGGLCVGPGGTTLFIADTNNHAIRMLDLETREVTQLNISREAGLSSPSAPAAEPFRRLTGKRAQRVQCDPVHVPPRGEVRIALSLTPPPGCHWTEGAPSAWQVIPDVGTWYSLKDGQKTSGSVSEKDGDITVALSTHIPPGEPSCTFQVEVMLYFCEQSGLCHMQGAVLDIPLVLSDTTGASVAASVRYTPELPKVAIETQP